jgi:hypothetical protein
MRNQLCCYQLIPVNFAGYGILLVVSTILATYACADQSVPDNWREKCRQIVSGQYLQHYDSQHQFDEQSKMLERQIIKMTADLGETRQIYDKLEAKSQNSEFDKDQANQLQNLRTKLKMQESLLADKKSALTKTQERLELASGKLQRFTAKVEPLFRIDRKKPEEADPGYGIRLEFSSPCPQHRHVCPLPSDEATKLRDLSAEIEGSDACVKYSQIRL